MGWEADDSVGKEMINGKGRGGRGGGGIPVHDHVNWLGVDFVRYDFGVLSKELEDSIRSRIPGDLTQYLK